jgi:SAM-dependent methyltransferase
VSDAPEGRGRFFEAVARHAGAAYLRYSFTKGTEQEVAFLAQLLSLGPGVRVLDVGCGPGRHAGGLAELGADVTGLDIAEEFLVLARDAVPGAAFVRADARRLPFGPSFDLVLSLCQGGFGLTGDDGDLVLEQMAAVLRPGGRVVLTAFSAYFAVRFLEEQDTFDAEAGINHEVAGVKNPAGEERQFDLWTSCFTPRELRLLCRTSGLEAEHLWAVAPGRYGARPPDLEHPEWLLVARKP